MSPIGNVVTRICRSDLIVVDDIVMLPVDQDAAEGFYRVIGAAYEHRAVAITSNLRPRNATERKIAEPAAIRAVRFQFVRGIRASTPTPDPVCVANHVKLCSCGTLHREMPSGHA